MDLMVYFALSRGHSLCFAVEGDQADATLTFNVDTRKLVSAANSNFLALPDLRATRVTLVFFALGFVVLRMRVPGCSAESSSSGCRLKAFLETSTHYPPTQYSSH